MSTESDHDYIPGHRERFNDTNLKKLRQALYDAKMALAVHDNLTVREKLIEALDITQEWT